MTQSNFLDRFHFLQPHVFQMRDRLAWAPVLANGAAVLALAGIVGNVDDPDAALRALTTPLICFGAGLTAGILATTAQANALEALASKVIRAQNLAERQRIASEALERLEAQLAQLRQNTAELRSNLVQPDDHAAVDRESARLGTRIDAARQESEVVRSELLAASHDVAPDPTWSRVAQTAAIVLCAVGFGWLLIGHASGLVVLQPSP